MFKTVGRDYYPPKSSSKMTGSFRSRIALEFKQLKREKPTRPSFYLTRSLNHQVDSLQQELQFSYVIDREDQRVEATQHNETHSRLHRLPVELLLDIHDHLSGSSSLALQATCLNFRLILRRNGRRSKRYLKKDREEFMELLKTDQFFRDCEEERLRKYRGTMLLCGGCRVAHHAKFFTMDQLRKDPAVRLCFGRTGTFRMCEHYSLGFSQLKNKTWGPWSAASPYNVIRCPSRTHDQKGEGRPTLQKHHSDFWTFSSTHIFPWPVLKTDPIGILQLYASNDSTPICPHLRVKDLDLLGKSPWLPAFDQTYSYSMCYDSCKVKDCGKLFHIEYRWDKRSPSSIYATVELVTESSMRLSSPTNPSWLAQIEDLTQYQENRNQSNDLA